MSAAAVWNFNLVFFHPIIVSVCCLWLLHLLCRLSCKKEKGQARAENFTWSSLKQVGHHLRVNCGKLLPSGPFPWRLIQLSCAARRADCVVLHARTNAARISAVLLRSPLVKSWSLMLMSCFSPASSHDKRLFIHQLFLRHKLVGALKDCTFPLLPGQGEVLLLENRVQSCLQWAV